MGSISNNSAAFLPVGTPGVFSTIGFLDGKSRFDPFWLDHRLASSPTASVSASNEEVPSWIRAIDTVLAYAHHEKVMEGLLKHSEKFGGTEATCINSPVSQARIVESPLCRAAANRQLASASLLPILSAACATDHLRSDLEAKNCLLGNDQFKGKLADRDYSCNDSSAKFQNGGLPVSQVFSTAGELIYKNMVDKNSQACSATHDANSKLNSYSSEHKSQKRDLNEVLKEENELPKKRFASNSLVRKSSDSSCSSGFSSQSSSDSSRLSNGIKSNFSRSIGQRWTPKQDEDLRKAVQMYEESNWKAIAERVEGRNHVQCLQRWKKVLQPGLVKGMWSREEDNLLTKLMSQFGKNSNKHWENWAKIAEHVPGRSAKQCRERWRLNLDPSINRDPWTPQEDEVLMMLHSQKGNSWAEIKRELSGRTENAVKSRYKSIMRARQKCR